MIRSVFLDELGGFTAPGIVVRDHFRRTPENHGGPRFALGPLWTLAETTIEPRSGFPMHGHRDFEIVSYVCEGELTHADTLGHRGQLGPGDVQVMTTGTGILHSEMNHGAVRVHMFQIWFAPTILGLQPGYIDLAQPKRPGDPSLQVLVSGMPDLPGAAAMNQDAAILGADLAAGSAAAHRFGEGRLGYVLVPRGRIALDGVEVASPDAAAIAEVESLAIEALEDSEILLIDVPETDAGNEG